MGILEQVIGSVLGSRPGGGSPMGGQMAGGQGGMSPLVMALMSLLASQAAGRGGAGGGLGGLLGGLTGGSGGIGGGGSAGGLGGLMDSFRRSGHGDVMDSWIGTGANREISPNQLGEAMGPGTVDDLSRQTGMGRDDLLAELSKVLPGVVDGVTPHGRLPEADEREKW